MEYKEMRELPLSLDAPIVSRVLGISRSGAYALMRSETFPSFSIGKRRIVTRDAFLKWIDAQTDVKY